MFGRKPQMDFQLQPCILGTIILMTKIGNHDRRHTERYIGNQEEAEILENNEFGKNYILL